MARKHIVALRYEDEQYEQMQRIAELNGTTVSMMVYLDTFKLYRLPPSNDKRRKERRVANEKPREEESYEVEAAPAVSRKPRQGFYAEPTDVI